MFGLFEVDIKKLLLVALILALPIISVNLEKRDVGGVRWYDQPTIWLINNTQELFSSFSQGVAHTTSYYLNLLDVKKDNRVLKEELARLQQELTQREELKIENDRLKNALDFQKASPSLLLSAQVVGIDLWTNSEYVSVTINKGSTHGIKKRMGVVTREGIVGYILHVFPKYSRVLVFSDRNATADAIVERSRARGIVEGVGGDLCRLKYLQRTDDVQVGDKIVTGFDDVFPRGFPIGIVTKVTKKTFGVSQNVEVRPIVDTRRLEEVFVVIKPENSKSENDKSEESKDDA